MTATDTRRHTPWDLKPCGTPAAYRRHRRRGERPCDACLQAERLRNSDRYGFEITALSPDHREIRNGLPDFRPYRYRGLGYDQLTAWMDDMEAAS